MAASGNIEVGGLATFIVKVNGRAIPDNIGILSVYVEKKVNRISVAKVVVLDGRADTAKFDVSSSDTFLPGGEITIEAGYDSKNELIFKGIVTTQSIRIEETRGSALEIECHDAAVRMIVGRKNASFSEMKDSDIIGSIIGNYAGLSTDVTATTTVWPQQVQYYVTDWDFIISLAEANGLIVTTLNGKVSVFKPDANTSAALTIKFGDGLLEFNADLNSISQLGTVKASAWDYKNQTVIFGDASSNLAGPGNLSSKKLSEVIDLPEYHLQTTSMLENIDLTNWSSAQLIKSEFSKIRGEAKFQGTSIAEPGKYITLQGIGDRFSGNHFISGVVHNLSEGNWVTEVSIGLSPIWFIEEPDVMSPPASGLLPAARGLFIGTVRKMYDDPNSQFRILVDVPMFDQQGAGLWARLSNFYSTSGAGAFFLPEAGDEVVLGFLNEDPRCPVILGSMYSNSKIKPYMGLEPSEKNPVKAIVSKSGIAVEFDDENGILTIATPGKNTVVLTDKDKQIIIKDENSNSIIMSQSGITIKSATDINIEADQHINLKGTQGLKIESPAGDVETSGINIKETADSQYSMTGGEIAKLNSGMEMTLKSTMIMIN